MYKCYPKMLMIKKLKNISSCRYSCATFKAGVDLQEASSQECDLKAAIATKIPEQIEIIKKFRKENGNKPVGEVTVDMLYNGMRGIKGLICETSVLDPEEGIRFRGYTVTDCQKNLPKMTVCGEPLPEGIFWLLCTGEIPTEAQVKSLSSEWAARSKLPDDLKKILDSVPSNIHPMSQFSAICTLLNRESKFAQAYGKGILKSQYWEYVYEDSMDLIGKIPSIAASIYLRTYKNTNDLLEHCATKDWSLNFTNMLGFDNDEFTDLMRLYLTIHSDHEGGNVSAHATHLVGSALSDPYLSYAAGMNGLAGPLHGRANQEVLEWCLKMIKEIGEIPTDDQIKDFVMKTLKSGKVIPGYGHAVLRTTDPRFNVLYEFAQTHIQEDNLVNLVSSVFRVVPPVLLELGKVKNPWPNVDAHSGVLLYHYGMTEMSFYTVLFGVSRALGVLASLIWNRALGFPIERPKSLSTNNLIKSLI